MLRVTIMEGCRMVITKHTEYKVALSWLFVYFTRSYSGPSGRCAACMVQELRLNRTPLTSVHALVSATLFYLPEIE